jgi:hypothetical protein
VFRLAYWNADEVRGRKLQPDHILSQHDVDVYLLHNAHFKSDQVVRVTNCVCHWTDRLTNAGGRATFVRRAATPYAVPACGLKAIDILSVGQRATESRGIPSFTRPTLHSLWVSQRRISHLDDDRPQCVAHGLEPQAYHALPKHALLLRFKNDGLDSIPSLPPRQTTGNPANLTTWQLTNALRSWPAPSRRSSQYRLPSAVCMAHCCLFCLLVSRIKYDCRSSNVSSDTSYGLWKPTQTSSRTCWNNDQWTGMLESLDTEE